MTRRDRGAGWVVPTLVAALAVVAFLPALNAGFVDWDDDKNFITNYGFRGLGPGQLRWMWSTFHLGTWIPLSWMSLGLDYLVWGMNPVGYHLTNLLLHGANAALLYFVAARVLRAVGIEATGSDRWSSALPAAFAALFFAIHPLRVESVAWITERRDVLAGLFYLGAVLAYLRASDDGPRRRLEYWGSVALGAFALLSKGTAVTLPVALLILNVYPLRRLGGESGWGSPAAWRVYRELLPFAALAAAFTVVVFVALQPVEQLGIPGKVAVSAYSLWFYFSRTIVPLRLSPLYSLPEAIDPLAAVHVASYVAVGGGAALAWLARRRWPGVSIALLAFAAILFPLLGVHQGGPQLVADRNTYNAAWALALLAGAAFALAARRRPRVAVVAGGALLLWLGTLTWKQTGVWRDSGTLWAHVLSVEPNSPLGHNNFGNLLMREGRTADAIAHYRAAIAAKPDLADAHLNLGVALARDGRPNEAIVEYARALEYRPVFADAESNWGVALALGGNFEGAIEHYARAIAMDPTHADARVNWGNALVRLGRAGDAIAHYQDALRYQPDHAEAELNWGVALALTGRPAEAAPHFERVLVLQPDHPSAAEYLARVRGATPPATATPP